MHAYILAVYDLFVHMHPDAGVPDMLFWSVDHHAPQTHHQVDSRDGTPILPHGDDDAFDQLLLSLCSDIGLHQNLVGLVQLHVPDVREARPGLVVVGFQQHDPGWHHIVRRHAVERQRGGTLSIGVTSRLFDVHSSVLDDVSPVDQCRNHDIIRIELNNDISSGRAPAN